MDRRGFRDADEEMAGRDLAGSIGSLVDDLDDKNPDQEVPDDVILDDGSAVAVSELEKKPENQDVEPDYGPGRDTVFRRETWPKYAYPARKKLKIPMAFFWAIAGLVGGIILSSTIFLGIRAIQERMMYQNVEQVIRAQWPNRDLILRTGYHDDLVNAPYYGSNAWEAMSPVENDDGSITLAASTSAEFCDLILAMREHMDNLMTEYSEDETFVGFLSASPSLDYDVITVQTQMHQSGLIDQARATELLRQMKIHNILYRAISNEEPEVRLVFVNNGETILTMRM